MPVVRTASTNWPSKALSFSRQACHKRSSFSRAFNIFVMFIMNQSY